MTPSHENYYVPEQSGWPILTTMGLALVGMGAPVLLAGGTPDFFALGLMILAFIFFGWFRRVVIESQKGLYSAQMDVSFRLGMIWFIFSEVMFFAAFFGALFYVRTFAVPWLGGAGSNAMTGQLLWPDFIAAWPLLDTPATGFDRPSEIVDPFHLPLLNTILLVSSSITLTFAHHCLKQAKRWQASAWLAFTVALGIAFLWVQGIEYVEAYTHSGLTLRSGIYGSTFFILTGFHGIHVTLGTIILLVMLIRLLRGHFNSEHHFGFEAAAWYWHFVDVVWLGLFFFVYVF
ncbi:Cytochrome c oxidase subunit 3 [Marinomonas aquimarina]|uniref:cytochrome-c oxidase n=1 Tax=Marinomonas aquimarina TaxID=295068 RepID=A0A1A8TRZ9_9GAMM|nr:cytochrome c oxidase subunit 3 [Marinomonas aquimarina]SBS36315.1 Cytochrome c oxidase subunit 3 [Marinomonas aquimarina]